MQRIFLWSTLLLFLFFPTSSAKALQQAEYEIKLISPGEGSAVQGLVEILGTTDTDDFVDYEISFSIMTEDSPTWFPIFYSQVAVDEGALAEWNTSTLTDGTYSIKLLVNLLDQEPFILIIENIRVRNYSPIETSTPAPTRTTMPGELPTATASPLPPTVTAIPDNPAQINRTDINSALKWGIGTTIFSLILLGLYSSRKNR
jgi:hypothetical protein